MKTLTKAIIAFCLLGTASCIHSRTPQNSSAGPNLGFEYDENGLPVNWIYYNPPGFEQQISVDTGNPKEGKQSLRFEIRKSAEGGRMNFSGLCKEFPDETKGGGKFRISFWVKNQGINCSFITSGVNAKNRATQSTERTESADINEWQKIEMESTFPEDMWLRIEVKLKGKGVFRMDGVVIEKI